MSIFWGSEHPSVSQADVSNAGARVFSSKMGRAIAGVIANTTVRVIITDDPFSSAATTTKTHGGTYEYEIRIPKQHFDGDTYEGADGNYYSTSLARILAHEFYHVYEFEMGLAQNEYLAETFADDVMKEYGELPNVGLGSLSNGTPGAINLFGPEASNGTPGGGGGPTLPPASEGPSKQGSPLVLDLGNDGINLIEIGEYGIYFDLRGSGQAVLTGWVAPEDGLLALDINENGIIDNITELFGNISTDGFSMLASYDLNEDGIIDSEDVVFSNLLVWIDENSDGISQSDEQYTLSSLDITSISLESTLLKDEIIAGNRITHESTFVMDGTEQRIVDSWFSYDIQNTRTVSAYDLDIRVLLLPELRGSGDLKDLHIAVSIDNSNNPSSLIEKLISITENITFTGAFDDWGSLEDLVEDLMLTWASVTTTNSTGRGSYVDGQHLAFYEVFTGEPFLQHGKSNPLPEAGKFIEAIYNHIKTVFIMHIIAQTVGDEIFESPKYNLHTGGMWGNLDLLQAGIDAIEDAAINATAPVAVWARFAQFIGYTKGLGNLTVGEIAALDAAVAATGEPSLNDWQDVVNFMTASLGSIIDSADDWGSFEIVYDSIIEGTSGNDTVTDTSPGGATDNLLKGLAGNDILNGLDGHDKLVGGDGNDTLNGGTGDDFLLGGEGDDVYQYTSGNDTISEEDGDGYDVIHVLASTGLTTSNIVDLYRYGDQMMIFLTTGSYITIYKYAEVDSGIEKLIFDADSSEIDFTTLLQQKFYGTAQADNMVLTGDSYQTLLAYGYGSNDRIEADGAAAKFYGGDGYDVLIGDYLADTLYGEAGGDYLLGMDGNDKLYGGTGEDRLEGGDDNDTLYGEDGNDVLDGGEGNDRLEGANGNDTYLFGLGYGQDIIRDMSVTAGSTNDRVRFLAGIAPGDVIVTQTGNNAILLSIDGTSDSLTLDDQEFYSYSSARVEFVEFENSTVWTAADLRQMAIDTATTSGNDTVYGWSHQNDTLDAGAGNDYVNGRGGDDTYVFGLGYGQDTFEDDGGYDTVNILSGVDPADILVTKGASDSIVLSIIGTSDSVTFYRQEYYSYNVNRLDEVVFADTTVWSSSDLRQMAIASQATSGNDTISAFITNDTLAGGAGNDTLQGREGDDVYLYNLGDGQDTIQETNGADYIRMGAGILSSDISLSQVGNNLVITITSMPSSSITVTNHYQSSSKAVEKIVLDDTSEIVLIPVIMGTSGNDTLNGNSSANLIYGLAGNDTIDAGAGNDIVYGDDGNDLIDGGNGNDALFGGAGDDTIDGEYGDDYIEGNEGNDTLYGYYDDDIIYGNDGDDYLNGGADFDTLYGGTGNDHLVGGGDDDLLYGEDGNDLLYGGTQNDVLYGGIGDDSLYGESGNDILYGDDGDDHLDGGSGNDTLYGGNGIDILHGGSSGTDTLYGGSGNDVYLFEDATGISIVDDDSGAADVIKLVDSLGPQSLAFSVVNTDHLRITYGTNDHLTIVDHLDTGLTKQVETLLFTNGFWLDLTTYSSWVFGTSSAQTTNGGSGVDTIFGRNGNDTINGNAGNDHLSGDAGDDTLNGGDGDDYLHGGAGNDVINGNDDNDFLYGFTGNDVMNGGDGNDYLHGDSGTDTLSGGNGNDILAGGGDLDTLTGGYGQDTFVFSTSSAFSNVDVVTDFSALDNDILDLRDILGSVYDPVTQSISDFVSLSESSGHTFVSVDRDGTGGTYSMQQIAKLENVTGLGTATALETNGQIVTL